MESRQLVVNTRHVVHETIDDETILIHLGTGVYYSLDGSGSAIWALASRGVPVEDVVAAVRAAHPSDPQPEAIDLGVRELLDRLVAEELLVPGIPDELPGQLAVPGGLNGFAAPSLQKYTDMQEFMLVDPLHEVDEQAGWPHVKSG